MRWGSPRPGKEERVGRGVARMGKDREGHGLGEPCVAGAMWEAVGASWGGGRSWEEHQLLPLGIERSRVHRRSRVQFEVVRAALLCQAREEIDCVDRLFCVMV